jgi:hypothetical protein
MKEQKSYWLRQIVGYLNRTGAPDLVIPKEAQHSNRIADDIEQYLLDIKQMFIDKCEHDPSCRKDNLEHAWKAMEGVIRRDVEKLLEKSASVREPFRDGSDGELEKRFLDNIKRQFIENIKHDPDLLKDRDPEKIWDAIQKSIRVEVQRVPVRRMENQK